MQKHEGSGGDPHHQERQQRHTKFLLRVTFILLGVLLATLVRRLF